MSRTSPTRSDALQKIYKWLFVPCDEKEKKVPADDIARALAMTSAISDYDFRLGTALIDSPRFKSWTKHENVSDVLLVEAYTGNTGPLSPLSFVCAHLAKTLRPAQQQAPASILVTQFFCGLHTESDLLRGPYGLMRSLLDQIVALSPGILDEERLDCDYDGDNPLMAACQLFHEIIRQLPKQTTLYCIIDGISQFDSDPRYLQESIVSCECLVRCRATQQAGAGAVKILVTRTRKTKESVRNIFQPWGIISL